MSFNIIKHAVAKQFAEMSKGHLFVTDTDKDKIWDTYLNAFPENTNPIYRERTEHDCTCCKQFIRAVGNIISIDPVTNKLVSIWDIKVPEEPDYQVVADALSKYVKSKDVVNVFLHDMRTAGTDKNFEEMLDGTVKEWKHFFVNIPERFVVNKYNIGTKLSENRSTFDVFYRGLTELKVDALETVVDLITQNSLYRGQEFLSVVSGFLAFKNEFDKLKTVAAKKHYTWMQAADKSNIGIARIRNTAIGTLLIDLSSDIDIEEAVSSFERKVAGDSYKRPTAIYTEKMKQAAAKTVEELGLTSALGRRRAVMSDVTINNVLFADRDAKPKMAESPFDAIADSTAPKKKAKNLDKVEEVNIEKFIKDILPTATGLELYLENNHQKNLVNLIAPVDPTAGKLFKWDSNFSWAYNGNMADSLIKERVKAAGGNVDAEVCFRLAWSNFDDLDLHMVEPGGKHIYFGNYRKGDCMPVSPCGGQLDVDMNAGGGNTRTPVENIYYGSTTKMKSGRYRLYVNQYSSREKVDIGFEIEMQIRGDITHYAYSKPMRSGDEVTVVEFDYDAKTGEFKIVNSLEGSTVSKDIWGLSTNQYHKVTMAMFSPNHWDDQEVGNKHYMFMLNGCSNPEPARGFFNEFLRNDLNEHRKVFEALGSKMLCSPAPDELSGVAFSSTQRASVLCKVSGSFNRVIKIVF